ncbi:MAG: hypothetical protein PHH00_02565 [Candidatus Nanoarchaeia archaeon]|nr:hypothetical protein [Candidatus Nanoarchaeia archaeon]
MFNKRGKNKKGISNIIATLLLVLLTIVILGILWVIVRNITSSAGEGISLGGLTLNLKIQDAGVGHGNISVLVQRQSGAGDLVGINFVAYDGEIYEVIERNATLDVYEGKNFILVVDEINLSAIKTVSVAPVYLSGSGAEQIGRITDTYTFSEEDLSGAGWHGGGDGGEEPVCGDGTCHVGETTSSCPEDCSLGGAVCGNGDLESGEQCDDGNIISGDGCSSTCQDEVPGAVCGNDICESNETEASCPSDCGQEVCVPTNCEIAGYQCDSPPNGCGGILNCGVCDVQTAYCNSYYQCEAYQMVNSGAVLSVWPSGAVLFYDSEDLPKSEIDLINYNDGLHYVRFPGSAEADCIRVALADYVLENNRSYISLYEVANIAATNNYQIWNAQSGCANHPGYP